MNDRRIARIQQQIKARIATALIHDVADPRIGFVTISRTEVDKEMQRCIVYWSMIGDAKAQKLTAAALDQAKGFLRREVAQILHTRSVPELVFRHDDAVEGAAKMRNLLEDLKQEREAKSQTKGDAGPSSEDSPEDHPTPD